MNIDWKNNLDFTPCPSCESDFYVLVDAIYCGQDVITTLKAGRYTYIWKHPHEIDVMLSCNGTCSLRVYDDFAFVDHWTC